ncbi:unnamed protein product [Heligmosomoides polygyrus]|uniref:Uncharacterized protein n=1 Tax=Heligmosomoides polygyrus TaxID=6339 RepID=A0A183FPP2_HELPZ|nr:unnamed protein product [Heligmosomoides polygyrus]
MNRPSASDGLALEIGAMRLIARQGERSFKTLYVSPAEDISDASQIEEVRIGLPRNWAMVEASSDDEEPDFSTDSCSEEDDESDDSSEEEEEQRPSTKETLNDSLPRDALDQNTPATMPLNVSAPNGASAVRMTRELSNYQRHIRAYEFDIIWMLIAMRYW